MAVINAGYRPTALGRRDQAVKRRRRRPATARPAGSALVYRGSGVKVSQVPHRPRPVSIKVTLLVAVLAGLITVWLMAVGQARGSDVGHSSVPEQLAVVQVQTGENLQHLAVRVAPDASVSRVVERIKQLNGLGSAALSPGQTLIVPVR